jgi:hypothetical protein
VLAASAHADTSATIAPLLAPDRLGARGTLSFTVQFGESGGGVPAPVRSSVLSFPAGLVLEIPHLDSCSPARLRARGADGCPAGSALGHGAALIESRLGSQTLAESISLWIFLGPLHNLQPAVEILGQGYTPLDERVVLSGKLVAAASPYGEALALSIPPIPTLPLEPDASIVTLSLVVGAHVRPRGREANTVRLPVSCATGSFPFATEFTYADGSSDSALATLPCP